MASENWFRRNSHRSNLPVTATAAPDVPDGLAIKCARCGEIIFNKDFDRSLKVCPKCGHHHRMSAPDRVAITADEGSFQPLAAAQTLRSIDFLGFPDYTNKLAAAVAKSGATDSFLAGTATIDGVPAMLGVSEFFFMGGSMGSVAGEKIALAIEEAIVRRLPVVLFTTSGGARMHEGLMSLMQMAKTAAACAQLGRAGLPLIVVLTDPTTGGVMASFASLGDVILSEPGALIALAGQRVAAQAAQGQKLPANYQSAEWRLERGHIDQIVNRRDLKALLARLLLLLGPARQPPGTPRSETDFHRNGHGADPLLPPQTAANDATVAP